MFLSTRGNILETKHWHCIDYVIMWKNDQSLCQDVNVRRSAECWTDHKLLYAKLSLKVQWRRVRKFKRRRYVCCSSLAR